MIFAPGDILADDADDRILRAAVAAIAAYEAAKGPSYEAGVKAEREACYRLALDYARSNGSDEGIAHAVAARNELDAPETTAARRYQHFQTSEEARKADRLPGAGGTKGKP